jgi:hypothetical protein
MRRQSGSRGAGLVIASMAGAMLLGSCRQSGEPAHSTAAERLRPAAATTAASTTGGTIYVPVYSAISLGTTNRAHSVDLAATVSVRNVSASHPITLDSVRYYDSVGKHVRDYLDRSSTLPALGSVEFVVQRADTAGGPGANFLIRWHADDGVDEPLVEAIMLGQSGNAGISFSSRGRPVTAAANR